MSVCTPARVTTRGFTLVELLVVMFLLAAFLGFLTQMLHQSLGIWTRGEELASLEERCATSLRLMSEDFTRLQGVETTQFQPGLRARLRGAANSGGRGNGRLVATMRPFRDGKPADADFGFGNPKQCDWFPELRMVTRASSYEARRMLEARERERVLVDEGQYDEEQQEERVRERLASVSAHATIDCLLRVLPTGDEDGCYLALFRDARLIDEATKKRWVDGEAAPQVGEPLLTNLLHVEMLFRSQWTETWNGDVGERGGPERCWDSARAGLFEEEHPVLRFSLDLGEASASDPRDDVMPSWVQIRVVVDEGPDLAYTSILASSIDSSTTDLRVEYPERMPAIDDELGYLKIGSEWIAYRGHDRGQLRGVRRGARHTKAKAHRGGARVHVGRTGIVRVPISVAREYWPHVR